MNLALWICQGLLAAIFTGSGLMKLARSKEQLLAAGLGALSLFSPSAIRALGAVELLGAIGLILPWLTGVAPVLTPLAAIGLAMIMAGAAVMQWRLRDHQKVGTVVVLFGVCLFVAIGRFV